MTCPTCGLNLDSTPPDTCPRCGRPLRADATANPYAQPPAPGQPPTANPIGQPPAPDGVGQPPMPDFGQPQPPAPSMQPPNPYGQAQPPNPYGQSPTPISTFGPVQPSAPFEQPPTPQYGQAPTPGYGQPPTPGYGQAQAPNPYGPETTQSYTPPFAGQPAQQPAPTYGQGAPPMPWPVAGGGKPGASPFKPARRRRAGGAVARIVGAVIVLAAIVVGALVYNAVKGDTVYSSALTGTVTDWSNIAGCSPESDGFHITAAVVCYAPTDSLNDVTLTVTVKQLSGDPAQPYGVAFRRVSAGNFYDLEVNSNGEWAFGKVVNGSQSLIGDTTSSAALHTGLNASNTLEVKGKGSHFTFYVNGAQVGQGDDSTYASGLWGLQSSDNIDVAFTNISITNTK